MQKEVSKQAVNKGEEAPCPTRTTCSSAGADGSGCSSCSSRATGNPQAAQDIAIRETLSAIRYPLFVMSGKGGVGKSSVTVNIAATLANRGFKVGILDVDMHGPSIPNLLGLGHGLDMDESGEKLLPAEYMPNLHVISMDSLLQNKDTAILWRGPKKTAAIRQFLADVEWGELDYLVIDSPPGTGDEHLTLLKTIPDALCVMVTTPQEISLADVRKAINFLQHVGGKILGLVENMSGLACPHCGENIPLFKSGGGKALALQYGIPFLGAISLDPLTVVAADEGTPVVMLDSDSAAKRDFLALGKSVQEACEQNKAVILSPPEEE